MSPILSTRLAMIMLSSIYDDLGDGRLQLTSPPPSGPSEPAFWPEPGVVFQCISNPKSVKHGPPIPPPPPYPPRGADTLSGLNRAQWINVTEIGAEGSTIVVGRVPAYSEMWGGSQPLSYRTEITLAEVDAFLSALAITQVPGPLFNNLFNANPTAPTSPALPVKLIGAGTAVGVVGAGNESYRPPPFDNRPVEGFGTSRSNSTSSNCWERVCCIGLDVDRKEVTAIIEIPQSSGYGGKLCDSKGFESVGFWLIEPSGAEIVKNRWLDSPPYNPYSTHFFNDCGGSVRFIGSKRIPVADISRLDGQSSCLDPVFQYERGSLRYSVSVPLSEDDFDYISHCSDPVRLPVLHAVVAFGTDVTNDHFGGRGIRLGDWDTEVVQYPILTTKPVRRETAVGILGLSSSCVLFSNVIRYSSNPPDKDTLAISVTNVMLEAVRQHGEMHVIAVKTNRAERLHQSGVVLDSDILAMSPLYVLSPSPQGTIIPANGVITPFDLPVGDAVICAVFGPRSTPIAWDPSRDMYLTGNGPSIQTTCVGLVASLTNPLVTVSGPHWIDVDLKYRSENGAKLQYFPPCLPNGPAEMLRIEKRHQLMIFYPLVANKLYKDTVTPIVILGYANGALTEVGGHVLWEDYADMIKQYVSQGAIFVIPYKKDPLSTLFLVDSLPQILGALEDYFMAPQLDTSLSLSPLFFIGHSMGGQHVAQVMTGGNLPAAIQDRISGAIMIAPSPLVGNLRMSIAPVLIVHGAMDPTIYWAKLPCQDKSFSDFILSPMRFYENSRAPFSAFILVDGATHFRWINHEDDVDEALGDPIRPIEGAMVLDGIYRKSNYPSGYAQHRAILLSYATYFYRATALRESNYLQFFLNPTLIPPDVLADAAFPKPTDATFPKIIDQLHLFTQIASKASINTLFPRFQSTYKQRQVERTINGKYLSEGATSTVDITIGEHTYPVMDTLVVIGTGTRVDFTYNFLQPLPFKETDILTAEYVILTAGGNVYTNAIKMTVAILLEDGSSLTVDLERVARLGRDIHLTYEKPDPRVTTVRGDMSTVEEIKLPLSWVLQRCFGSSLSKRGIPIQKLSIVCSTGTSDVIQFGLGIVQLVNLADLEKII